LQAEQDAPLDEEETNFPPEENPKAEKSFLTSSVPHFGQITFSPSELFLKISNLRLHPSHKYS
jgi:hypothetical protein